MIFATKQENEEREIEGEGERERERAIKISKTFLSDLECPLAKFSVIWNSNFFSSLAFHYADHLHMLNCGLNWQNYSIFLSIDSDIQQDNFLCRAIVNYNVSITFERECYLINKDPAIVNNFSR